MTPKETYYELFRIIMKHGDKHDKRHGNWVKLNLFNDYFLELDSWNKRIIVLRGKGEYCSVMGFSGKHFKTLGIDFGGFECDLFWTNYFLAHLGKYRYEN